MDIVEYLKDWAEFNGWQFRYAPNSVLNLEDALRESEEHSIYMMLLPVDRTFNTNDFGVVESIENNLQFLFLRKASLDGGNRDGGQSYYFEKYSKDIFPLLDIITGALPTISCGEETLENIEVREVVNTLDSNFDGVLVSGRIIDYNPDSTFTPRECGEGGEPVRIIDQDGNEIETVPCGGSYQVLVVSGIDAGNGIAPYVNQVIADPF